MSSAMKPELIAPCGMNCNVCSAYLAFTHDTKKIGIMKGYCSGCRVRPKECAFLKKKCDRLTAGKIDFCYECPDFPCRRLRGLDTRYRTFYHMSEVENLLFIKEKGMEQFLKKEAEKWRCPECGGIVCCHNGICFDCGLDRLKAKKRKYRWEK
jgi:hypothetical protein